MRVWAIGPKRLCFDERQTTHPLFHGSFRPLKHDVNGVSGRLPFAVGLHHFLYLRQQADE